MLGEGEADQCELVASVVVVLQVSFVQSPGNPPVQNA
jgi:hypothetical protein